MCIGEGKGCNRKKKKSLLVSLLSLGNVEFDFSGKPDLKCLVEGTDVQERVALSSYRCLNGREEEQHVCYLAESGAGGCPVSCYCFAASNASISTNFQADLALFAGNSVRKLPFYRGYN